MTSNQIAEYEEWNWRAHFGGGGFKNPVVKEKGKKPFKNITPTHKKVISLYFKGLSYEDIGLITNHSIIAIGQILNNPAVKEEIDRLFEYADDEFQGQYLTAIDAIRRCLHSNDEKTQLMAVDRFMKATGRYQKHDSEGDKVSAEEIVARIINHIQDGSIKSISSNRNHQRMIDITPINKELDSGSD